MRITSNRKNSPTRKASKYAPEGKGKIEHQGSRLLIITLVLAAFGPYIFGSIRTEQLAVYSMTIFILFTFIRLKAWTMSLIISWLGFLVAATIGLIFPYTGLVLWSRGNLFAGYDNILLPLIIALAIWSLIPEGGAPQALKTAAKTAAWASAVNAALAISSSLAPTLITPRLQTFWGTGGGSVAENAMEMGRFSGIFNQPAEAGLMYSIAAVLAVWAYAHKALSLYPLIILITIGGILSVSKVFLLVGLPVMLIMLLVTQRGASRLGSIVLITILGFFVLTSSFLRNWGGYNYMMRLLDVPADQSLIQFYTAGRWNENSQMLTVFDFVISTSPLVGFGASGLRVPYDSQWTETMVASGLIGTISVVTVFAILFSRFYKIQDWDTRCMAIAFWVVLLGGSFGISSLTANRAATIVWIVIALLIAIEGNDKRTVPTPRM